MRSRLPAILLVQGGLGHRFPFSGYRRFFGLRSWLAVSSVASGRIEFVSQHVFVPQFYGLSIHFQLLSTPCRHDAVTFSYPAGSAAGGGTFALCARSLSSALTPNFSWVTVVRKLLVTVSNGFP